jgi:hypothetical protein
MSHTPSIHPKIGSRIDHLGEQEKSSEMVTFFMPDSWKPLISLKIRDVKTLC